MGGFLLGILVLLMALFAASVFLASRKLKSVNREE